MPKRSRLSKRKSNMRIGRLWSSIVRGSKVRFDKPHTYTNIHNKKEIIHGEYYVTGFWADAMGLNRSDPTGSVQVFAPSKSLMKAVLVKGKVDVNAKKK